MLDILGKALQSLLKSWEVPRRPIKSLFDNTVIKQQTLPLKTWGKFIFQTLHLLKTWKVFFPYIKKVSICSVRNISGVKSNHFSFPLHLQLNTEYILCIYVYILNKYMNIFLESLILSFPAFIDLLSFFFSYSYFVVLFLPHQPYAIPSC